MSFRCPKLLQMDARKTGASCLTFDSLGAIGAFLRHAALARSTLLFTASAMQ